MRVLVVSPYLPHGRIGHGGGRAVRGLLKTLSSRHRCLLVSLLRPGEAELIESVRELGCDLVTVPFRDRSARGGELLLLAGDRLAAQARAWRDRYPFYVAKYASRRLTRAVTGAAASFRPDVIQIEYLQLAYLLRDLRIWRDGSPQDAGRSRAAPSPRLILDSHEIASLPRRRRAQAAGRLHRHRLLQQAAAWDRLARDASGWADTTLCVTDQDRRLLASAGGRRLATVPLGTEIPEPAPSPDGGPAPRILFLGSFQHPPNRSAAALLCDRIWPMVQQELPDWELVLAGPGSDAFLAARKDAPPRLRATGFVPDLAALFADCRIFAAPLTEGGGIKIKILEAMARGLPVVTTPIGGEGIVPESSDLVWTATDPDTFAAMLLEAARNPAVAADRARRARRHVAEHFGWDAVLSRLEAVYRGLENRPAQDRPERPV